MKMLKILFACYGKTGVCIWNLLARPLWASPLFKCSFIIATSWSFTLNHRRSLGTCRSAPFCLTRFIKPTRDARKFRLRRGSRLAVTERDDVARLSTGAPGSQPTLWNWPPRNICQTRLLVLTSSADTGAVFRSRRRGSVLLSACGCACVRRGRRKRKGNRSHWGNGAAKSFCCTDVRRKVDLNWPPTPGEKNARLRLHSLPATTRVLCLVVVDFSVTAHSSLARGFLKCFSAVPGIHTGILERWRFVCRVLLPGSTKLCRQTFNTVTNRATFSRELCLFVIKRVFFFFLLDLNLCLLDWCGMSTVTGFYFKNIQETV